ncbi:uncharacterized protein [Amphiura filiformis]|uniref:uncharacterized protein n=1 Tax=Amphiura filiformis TaxID=82378 RepID=UPI003B21BB18
MNDKHITPRSIKLKSNVSGHKADQILRNAERKLLNERVRQVNFTIDVLKQKQDQSSQKLSASLPRDAFDRVAEFTTHAQLAQHRKVKGRHLEKFQKLISSRADLDKDWRNSGDSGLGSNSEKWVKNISDRDLTKDEVSVLAKGLNYAVVPESVPVAEFVTVTESAVSVGRLNPSDAETLRHKICETLCNTELPQSNITKDERKALSELTKDENIAIVPADKGKQILQTTTWSCDGIPVSPIVVNLCMESFEQQALQSYPGVKPRLWLRFVDDTFVIIERTELEGFFQHINKLDDNIKFTQESCKDDTLAFLDCLISVKNDGSLTSNVYRKPTHTDHYLQFGSHHPLIHKLGVIRTLQYRADTIISENELIPGEKDHIKESLKNCGYPNWAFLKANKSRKDQKQPDGGGQPNKARVTIPYIAGLSERVKKHLKAFGISSSFKPNNTLRGKLVQVKDKQSKEKRSNLVYGLVCGDADCYAAYVGETKQALKARLNQHRRPSSNEAQNSAVYLHLKDTGHNIDTEDAVILDKEEQLIVMVCNGLMPGDVVYIM